MAKKIDRKDAKKVNLIKNSSALQFRSTMNMKSLLLVNEVHSCQ